MRPNVQLMPIISPHTHPFVKDSLRKGRPNICTVFQSENFNCASSECVAALRRHDYFAVARDTHFQWHAHGRFVAGLVGLDNGIPPRLLHNGVVWLGAAIALWRELCWL